MVQFFQPAALRDPGLAGSSGLIGSTTGDLTSLIRQRDANRNALVRGLLGGAVDIGQQMLQGKQARELQEQKLPIEQAKIIDDLGKAAQAERLVGNDPGANQLQDLQQNIIRNLLGTGAGDTQATLPGGGTILRPRS